MFSVLCSRIKKKKYNAVDNVLYIDTEQQQWTRSETNNMMLLTISSHKIDGFSILDKKKRS